jgi:hypothetical protein
VRPAAVGTTLTDSPTTAPTSVAVARPGTNAAGEGVAQRSGDAHPGTIYIHTMGDAQLFELAGGSGILVALALLGLFFGNRPVLGADKSRNPEMPPPVRASRAQARHLGEVANS